jgi:3(or 17)beta-hydroxysteroid dehydrogenase
MALGPNLLQDHIVLVTGSSGTLGQAMVAAIAAAGGRAITSDLAGDLAGGNGADGAPVELNLDVTREASWQDAAALITSRYGRLDGLVNNAGIAILGDVEQTSFADYQRVMAVNVDGVFLGCKYAMPLLARSSAPAIVNMSSAAGIVGGQGFAAYNASKGAVRLLTKSVALAGARKSPPVRCNSVHPAFVEGAMVDGLLARAQNAAATRARFEQAIPLNRMAEPREIADAVVYLLSRTSSFMTGAELVLDGGLTAQ